MLAISKIFRTITLTCAAIVLLSLIGLILNLLQGDQNQNWSVVFLLALYLFTLLLVHKIRALYFVLLVFCIVGLILNFIPSIESNLPWYVYTSYINFIWDFQSNLILKKILLSTPLIFHILILSVAIIQVYKFRDGSKPDRSAPIVK